MRSYRIVFGSIVAIILVGLAVRSYFLNDADNNVNPPVSRSSDSAAEPASVQDVKPEATALQVVENRQLSIDKRIDAIQSMDSNLKDDDIQRVKAVMFKTGEDEVLRNACGLLLREQNESVDLMNDLVAAVNNPNEEWRWVDYSIQFIPDWYESSSPDQQRKGLDTLLETIEGEDPDRGATALLSLQRISKVEPALIPRLKDLCRKNLTSDAPAMRRTASSILSACGDKPVLLQARKSAMRENGEILNRLSQIAILGQQGDESDLKRLEELSSHKNSRVRRVALYQATQLRKRL